MKSWVKQALRYFSICQKMGKLAADARLCRINCCNIQNSVTMAVHLAHDTIPRTHKEIIYI